MKHFKKNHGILFCLLILVFIFSYGSINSLAAASPKLKESKKTLYVGYETYKISCTDLTKDTKITYQSDNKSVANVSSKGMVTPVSPGNANITVTVKQGGKNYPLKLKVTVKNPYIIITNKIAEIEAGTPYTFEVKAVGLKDTDIVWSGSNRWAGEVNPYTGEFYPVYPGGITITAKDKKSGKTSVCHMRIERGDVAFNIINKIEEHWSDVSYRFKTEGAEQVRWSVSDTDMASIDQNGLFNAKKAGTVTVTAEDVQNGKISSFELKIKEIEESPAEIFNLIFNESYDTYFIQGMKDKTYTEIRIPEKYNGKYITDCNSFTGESQLKTIVIPQSINVISWTPFEGCSGLQSIVVLNRKTRLWFGDLNGCDNLKEFIMPYEGEITFAEYGFGHAEKLKKLILPDKAKYWSELYGVKHIGIVYPEYYTFEYDMLSYVNNWQLVIPASVTKLEITEDEVKELRKSSVIITPKNSAAEQFAIKHKIPYVNYGWLLP